MIVSRKIGVGLLPILVLGTSCAPHMPIGKATARDRAIENATAYLLAQPWGIDYFHEPSRVEETDVSWDVYTAVGGLNLRRREDFT